MQVNNNNLNAMMQLEKKLEQSAKELAKLNLNNEQTNQNKQKPMQQETAKKAEATPEVDVTKEMVTQVVVPLAYTANAEVISMQDSVHKTLLDIKA